MAAQASQPRSGHVHRVTRETNVEVTWVLDGRGTAQISTGVHFLDHMLDSLARHGLFDITVKAAGDLAVDEHHTVEDVAITMGQAFHQAVGDGRGIRRIAHAIVPMDEALATAAVDVSGRGMAFVELPLDGPLVGDLKAQMVPHFFQSLAREANFTLHLQLNSGANDHHRVETCFKALAKALDSATQIDERMSGEVPSTKGVL